jgi:hypothetical protein
MSSPQPIKKVMKLGRPPTSRTKEETVEYHRARMKAYYNTGDNRERQRIRVREYRAKKKLEKTLVTV